ncbi:hypothetical protein D3C71_1623940 [compost metagenome]
MPAEQARRSARLLTHVLLLVNVAVLDVDELTALIEERKHGVGLAVLHLLGDAERLDCFLGQPAPGQPLRSSGFRGWCSRALWSPIRLLGRAQKVVTDAKVALDVLHRLGHRLRTTGHPQVDEVAALPRREVGPHTRLVATDADREAVAGLPAGVPGLPLAALLLSVRQQ